MHPPETFEKTIIAGDYPALEVSFRQAVERFKLDDPLRPLIVLIPSHLLGMHLGRGLAEADIAHINIRFMTLGDFAEAVARPSILLSGTTAVPPIAREALMAQIAGELKTGDFYFSAIASRPGFHTAILDTIDDLKRGCVEPESLDNVCDQPAVAKACHPGKLRDIARLWETYEGRMRAHNWHDAADLDVMAAEIVHESPLVTEAAATILYGFYDLSETQRRIVKSCSEANHFVALIPFEDQRAFEYARAVMEWFRSEGFTQASDQQKQGDRKPAGAPGRPKASPGRLAPQPVERAPALRSLSERIFKPEGHIANIENHLEIISAPGEVREAREIIRLISREVLDRGVVPHEIAILTRRSHPYTGLFRDLLESMGVTPYILEGVDLKETRPGRSLRLLLEILRHNFSRTSVIEFATYASLREAAASTSGRVRHKPAVWDRISMEAGIVDGRDDWRSHLAEMLTLAAAGGTEQYGEGEVRSLIDFFDRLDKSLASIEKARTWSGKASTLEKALADLTEPEEETEKIVAAIRSLAVLDEVGMTPSSSDLYNIIYDLLTESSRSTGKFQRNGPSVMSLIAARGIPFKVVILPGLVEKVFPAAARQDAILLDSERQALNRHLTGADSGPADLSPIELKGAPHLDRERLFYRLAMGAATERLVLTFPRLDIGTARERVPSSFVLATIEAATGKRTDFDGAETYPGFDRVPLARIGTDDPLLALDRTEFDIAIAAGAIARHEPDAFKYLQATSDFFRASLNLEASRYGRKVFTAYDGILAGPEALSSLKQTHSILKRSVGPTRLETYATCPYRYYLGSILGLEALAEPERQNTINALDRGSLIHRLLWSFFTRVRDSKKTVPFTIEPADLSLLNEAMAETFADFEKRGVTGYPLMWEMEKTEIAMRMEELLDEEVAGGGDLSPEATQIPTEARTDEQGPAYLPAYFEVRYGMKSRGEDESDISDERPVPLRFGDREISLRGKVDRIDLSPDLAHARVIDYKTGRGALKYKPNDLMQGTSLQLALYLRAAYEILNRMHNEVAVDYAEYYSTSQTGKKRHIRFDYASLRAQRKMLDFILDTIADGIEAGTFFAHPQDTCTYCDFVRICGSEAEREAVYERKADDRRIKDFRKMKEMGSDD